MKSGIRNWYRNFAPVASGIHLSTAEAPFRNSDPDPDPFACILNLPTSPSTSPLASVAVAPPPTPLCSTARPSAALQLRRDPSYRARAAPAPLCSTRALLLRRAPPRPLCRCAASLRFAAPLRSPASLLRRDWRGTAGVRDPHGGAAGSGGQRQDVEREVERWRGGDEDGPLSNFLVCISKHESVFALLLNCI